jgi:CubicO group peptidase (beta-lactamase class C family)
VAWDLARVIARRDRRAVPGVAVGVFAEGRQRVWCDGITNVDNAVLVDEQTLFQLGSVSKVVTATAALALVDRGAFALGDLVADHLPDVDFGPAASTLTVEHLLTHRSGWQGDWSLFNAPAGHDADALGRMVSEAASVPRYSDPGGPFSYDNFGTCVAGTLIERTAKKSFDEAVRELVLGPLQMAQTVYWADDAIWRRVAVGHRSDGRLAIGTEPWADVWPVRRALWPQGGIVSSISDTLAFAMVHATSLASAPSALLPMTAATLAQMHVPRAPSGGQGSAVALGWHVLFASGVPFLTHTWAGQGFFARIVAVPRERTALVVLTNSVAGPSLVGDVFAWYLADVLGASIDLPEQDEAPTNASDLLGDYGAVSRTISVVRVTTTSVTVRVEDSGPTWSGTTTHELDFRSGQRLAAADGTRMEYGQLGDGTPWIRHRGRVHVKLSR